MKLIDKSIAVERVYFDTDGNEITQIDAGQVATVRVTMVLPESRHHVVLEDNLPAGFDPINVSLATEFNSNKDTLTEVGVNEEYDYPVWYSHKEMRDNRVVIFITSLGEGIYEYSYKICATTPGKFAALPARAYELYIPNVSGSGSRAVFTVNP